MALSRTRGQFAASHRRKRLAAGMLLATALAVSGNEELTTRPADTPSTQPSTQLSTAPATQPVIVEFQPGIRIDWGRRQVLVAGEVVLREGALELFACSPQTREHESIVCAAARPLHVYQALGLIGLEPGEPSYYEEDMKTYHPARGAPVEIEVRYTRDGRTIQHPIEEWMRNAQDDRPLDRQPWVFSGAFVMDDTFAADPEGTVVAVVDFPSAVIALPKYHSASNEALWLEPATERIPPVGSACTLIFKPGPILLQIDRQGRYHFQGRPALLGKVGESLKTHAADDRLHAIRLEVDPEAPPTRVHALRDIIALLDLPIDEGEMPGNGHDARPHEPGLLIPWMKSMPVPGTATRPASTTQSAPGDRTDPSAEVVWFQRTGELIAVAVKDLKNRYWPYPWTSQPATVYPPLDEPEGE
jgi:hypothetical protein